MIFTGVWVSRTLLIILSVLTNVVVWWSRFVRQLPSPPAPFSNQLLTVLNAPITIGMIVTCIFHSFLKSLQGRGTFLLFAFFQFYSVVSWDSKVNNFAIFLLFWLLLSLVFWQRLYDQSPIWVYVCYFLGRVRGLCIYHLFVWSNLNFLHISQSIT